MTDLLRLLRLFRPYVAWLLLGILLSFITLLANVALMALSGWFISAMAVAGAAGASMNYFTPAALIRAAAIVRTAGRYAERLVTHEATFRLLAELRVWFYRQTGAAGAGRARSLSQRRPAEPHSRRYRHAGQRLPAPAGSRRGGVAGPAGFYRGPAGGFTRGWRWSKVCCCWSRAWPCPGW